MQVPLGGTVYDATPVVALTVAPPAHVDPVTLKTLPLGYWLSEPSAVVAGPGGRLTDRSTASTMGAAADAWLLLVLMSLVAPVVALTVTLLAAVSVPPEEPGAVKSNVQDMAALTPNGSGTGDGKQIRLLMAMGLPRLSTTLGTQLGA